MQAGGVVSIPTHPTPILRDPNGHRTFFFEGFLVLVDSASSSEATARNSNPVLEWQDRSWQAVTTLMLVQPARSQARALLEEVLSGASSSSLSELCFRFFALEAPSTNNLCNSIYSDCCVRFRHTVMQLSLEVTPQNMFIRRNLLGQQNCQNKSPNMNWRMGPLTLDSSLFLAFALLFSFSFALPFSLSFSFAFCLSFASRCRAKLLS